MLNQIHMPTVVMIGVAIETLCLFVMVAMWRQNRQALPGLGLWALHHAMQCAGLFLILLRGRIPDLVSIGLPNLFFVFGSWLGYLGLEQFVGVRRPKRLATVVLGSFAVLHVLLIVRGADINARALNMTATSVFVFALAAWLLLRQTPPRLRTCTRWVGRVFVLCAVIYAIRVAALVEFSYLETLYFQSGWRESLFLMAVTVLFVLLTYAIGLMINQRLLIRVDAEREKFAKAFRASPQAVIFSRLEDGRVLEVNPGFSRIFGFAPEEACGRTSVDLGIWASVSERNTVMDRVRRDGRIDNQSVTWHRRDGTTIHGLYAGAKIDLDGTPCLVSVITDITAQLNEQRERERLLADREKALAEVRVLSGLLPICSACKKIRDDKGYWNQIETYIHEHSDAEFTHGMCPDCMRRLYPEYADDPPKG